MRDHRSKLHTQHFIRSKKKDVIRRLFFLVKRMKGIEASVKKQSGGLFFKMAVES